MLRPECCFFSLSGEAMPEMLAAPNNGLLPIPTRNPGLNTKSQLICAHSLWAFLLLFMAGWVFVARFLPPQDPSASAAQVASYFAAHSVRIRFGMLLCLYSTVFLMPFAAVIAAQISRIEGDGFKVWTYTMIGAGAGNVLTFTFPIMFWVVAAYRTDRPSDLVLLVSDLCWIPFVGMTSPFLVMPLVVAIAGFMDKSPHPVFPRWFCFYNLAEVAIILPGGLMTFFQTGPFAWNGMIGWWFPVSNFFVWFIVLYILLVRGIKAQAGRGW